MIKTGTILKSKSISQDDYFANAHIIIVEATNYGISGLIFNKKYPRYFNELTEFKNCPPLPLYEGGPVEQEKLFFLHRKPDSISGGFALGKDIFFGGDFKQAVSLLDVKLLPQSDIKLFIGYCGWDAGQLENEIAANEWEISDEDWW